jgi:hypothetical protein
MYPQYLIKSLMLIAVFGLASPVSAKLNYVRIAGDESIPTIEVFQTTDQEGRLRYTTLKRSNFPDPNIVNLRVKVRAQCKFGYLLSAREVKNDHLGCWDRDCRLAPQIITEPVITQHVPFTQGNRTLGSRFVDFHVPLPYFASVIEYGNEQAARRAGSIIEENNIRANDWTAYLEQSVGLGVRCRHAVGYTGLDKFWGYDSYARAVRVVYRGASAEFDLANPALGQGGVYDPLFPPHSGLSQIVGINAQLLALPTDDPNECKLDLSGTFTTNGPTTIFYHLVNEIGEMSPVFRVAVDHTHTAFVHHRVDLSEREPEGPTPSIDQGFSSIPTDRLQGFYQIEVVSPQETTSNFANYDIGPCTNRPDTIHSIVGN